MPGERPATPPDPHGSDPALASATTISSEAGAATLRPAAPAGAAEGEARPGDVVGGRYRLIAELGRGAFGVVLRAHDQVADEVIAIKIIARGRAHSPEVIGRVRRELRAARKVTHPSVVRIHDLIELGAELALTMELVEGETLAARLRRGPPLTGEELVRLATDLARALEAAHAADVVHRDLKPANVILRAGTGRAVVTDFGVSRLGRREVVAAAGDVGDAAAAGDLTRDGAIVGTPLYMAPEQLRGAPEVGPAADVYALGVVLFEAATGAPPHTGTLPEILAARARPAPRLAARRSGLPPGFAALVDRCLAPDPAGRPADGRAVRQILEPRGVTGALGAARARPRPGGGRRLAVALGLAALVAAGGALAGSRIALPRGERRVAITATNTGAPGDDALATAAARLCARRVGDRTLRLRVVDDPAAANVTVRLTLRRDPGGAILGADVGRPGGWRRGLGEVRAPTLARALDEMAARIAERVGAGRPELGPSAVEAADMRALGAASYPAYRLYRRSLADYFGTVTADVEAIGARLEEALRLDPAWSHLYLARAFQQGSATPAARATVAAGLRVAAATPRDPGGALLLRALEATVAGDANEGTRLFAEAAARAPSDLAAHTLVSFAYRRQARVADQIAALRTLNHRYPELQYGADLVSALRAVGRQDEVPGLIADWRRRAPESEQALISSVALAAERGEHAAAERDARLLTFLHGEAPHRLTILCDVLIMADRYREARAVADELLRGSKLNRALGRYRIGVIAILEGRFAAAYEALQGAVEDGREFGMESEIVQALDELRSLAPLVGTPALARTHAEDLAATLQSFGFAANAAVVRYEIALAAGGCPDLDDAVAALPAGPAREIGRRDLLRAAAEAGCHSCAEAVKAGRSATERDTRSLYRLGVCAAREGALQLAADIFEKAQVFQATSIDATAQPSAYLAVLAHYHLAQALARLGRADDARVQRARLLVHWGHADRPVPEVERTRREAAAR